VPAEIIDGEVAAEENVTNDPQVTAGKLNIHAHERGDTGSLNLKNVVGSFQWVGFAAKVERQIGEVRDFGTINLILAIPGFGSTDLRVKHLRNVGWCHDEGCTCVYCGSSVLELQFVITKGYAL